MHSWGGAMCHPKPKSGSIHELAPSNLAHPLNW